jgi:hypothetical protein
MNRPGMSGHAGAIQLLSNQDQLTAGLCTLGLGRPYV